MPDKRGRVILIIFIFLLLTTSVSAFSLQDIPRFFITNIIGRITQTTSSSITVSHSPLEPTINNLVTITAVSSGEDIQEIRIYLNNALRKTCNFGSTTSRTGYVVSKTADKRCEYKNYIKEGRHSYYAIVKTSTSQLFSQTKYFTVKSLVKKVQTTSKCNKDDNKDLYTKGTCQDPSGTYKDACTKGNLAEFKCLNDICVANIISCPQGYECQDGACVEEGSVPLPPYQGYLDIATIKREYSLGEQVELTDPPQEKSFVSIIFSNSYNLIRNIFISSQQSAQGFDKKSEIQSSLDSNKLPILKEKINLFSIETERGFKDIKINNIYEYNLEENKEEPFPEFYRKRLEYSIQEEVSSISVTGKASLYNTKGFARVIIVTEEDIEYLVFGTDFFFLDKGRVRFNNICEETCIFDNSIKIKEVRIELYKASLYLDKIIYQTPKIASKQLSEDELRNIQQEAKLELLQQIITNKNLGWTADKTSVSALPYRNLKKHFTYRELGNLWGFQYYRGGIFKIPKE